MQNKYKKLIVGAVGLTGAATLGAVQHFYHIAVDSNNKTIQKGQNIVIYQKMILGQQKNYGIKMFIKLITR